MSADTIDDLHAAEDRIGDVQSAVSEVLDALRGPIGSWDIKVIQVAVDIARSQLEPWCRPSCGWRVDGECLTGEDDCGCTCGHGEETQ